MHMAGLLDCNGVPVSKELQGIAQVQVIVLLCKDRQLLVAGEQAGLLQLRICPGQCCVQVWHVLLQSNQMLMCDKLDLQPPAIPRSVCDLVPIKRLHCGLTSRAASGRRVAICSAADEMMDQGMTARQECSRVDRQTLQLYEGCELTWCMQVTRPLLWLDPNRPARPAICFTSTAVRGR